MNAPLILYAGTLAQGAPLVAAAVAHRPVRGARAWILIWCAFLLVESGIQYWFAAHSIRNLWLYYWLAPIDGTILLWALSGWQRSDLARLTMRIAILPFVGTLVLLSILVEDTSFFSRVAEPLAGLVGLFAATFTLVACARRASGDLLRQDWFWVCAGVALYQATLSMIGPFSALLVGTDPAKVKLALQFDQALSILCFLAIARGMTCPTTTAL